jgi:site-specific DNA-methyltransferase (adenine-specific)
MAGHEAVERKKGSAGLANPRSGAGRTASAVRNHHNTVKPVALMRWLVRLVTPPGGTVLDTFAGSGTTGVAAALEGVAFIGIEREPAYVDIARARIAYARGHAPEYEPAERAEAFEPAVQLGLF